MISTRFTAMFDLAYPVMSAPMALHSGGTLAGAVSAAGGLGSFGGIHPTKGPEWLRDEVDIVRATTERPFAIGFITPFLGFTEELFATALAARPAAVAFSFADPAPWVERWYEADKPTDDPKLALISQIWDADGQLDWLAAWLWTSDRTYLTGDSHTGWTPSDDATVSNDWPVDRRWLDDVKRQADQSRIPSPYGGGSNPLHLGGHIDGPLQPRRKSQVRVSVDRTRKRRAVLTTNTMTG